MTRPMKSHCKTRLLNFMLDLVDKILTNKSNRGVTLNSKKKKFQTTVEPRLTNTLVRRTPLFNEQFWPVPNIFPIQSFIETPEQANTPLTRFNGRHRWSQTCPFARFLKDYKIKQAFTLKVSPLGRQ